MTISILQTVIASIVPFAQLYFRIFDLNGSIDKPWLLIPIFFMPPFSIIPALMMYFGYVKEGEGGKPYDYYMLIPIIFNIIIAIVSKYIESSTWIVLLSLIPFIGGLIAFYLRYNNLCTKGVSITKIITDSVITQVIANITYFILSYVPMLGTIFMIADYIPLMPEILTGVIYLTIYMIMNMINGNNINEYCNTSASIPKWIGFGLGIVGHIGVTIANQYIE